MANKIEYIFSLRDQISARLGSITATSDRTVAALSGVQDKVRSADSVCRDTGRTLGSLKMKIDALQAEREWIPADNIPAIREYNREIARLTDEIEELETAAGGGKFKKWASEAFDAIPGAGLLKNPLVTGITAVGAAGMAGMSFDENMAQVNITAQLDEAGLDDLKKRLKQIAAENKTDVQVTPVGFEAINSQVNDVDLSLSILDAALKGSKAGFTDLDTVSAALAQTLSIVGKENTTAQEVLDTFFAAKRVGAGEFADFARYMPNLIAGADNLGIAYKEVAGTFAYMTGKGQSAERAATLMENAFSVLGRVDVRDKLAKAGVDVFDDTGKIRSVVDIFTDLEGVLGRMNDEQKSSFLEKAGLVDKEAKSAFAVLTSDIGKLKESMNDVANSAGETDTALGYSANSMQKATEVWNQFKNIGTEVGELTLPVISAGLTVAGAVLAGVSSVLEVVIGFFSGWYSLIQEGNPIVVGFTTTLGILTAAMALNYAWTQKAVVIGGIKKVMDIAQTAVTGGLTAAQWALNAAFAASPIGWVAVAIGAVITAVTYCWQKFEGFRVVILGTWEVIKEFGRTLLDSIVKPFKQVLSGIGGVCSAIVSMLKGNFKEAAGLAKEGFKDIGEGVLGANPVSAVYNTLQKGNYSAAWEKGKQAGKGSWAASQETNDADAASQLTPEMPDVVKIMPEKIKKTDFDSLMAKLDTTGKKKKSKTLRLDDNIKNLNASAEYTAITRKLEPANVTAVPVSGSMGKPIPMTISSASTKVDDSTQTYDAGETNYLADIMQNVRKIAAAVAVPVMLASAPNVQAMDIPTPGRSDAYNVENIRETNNQFTTDNSRTYNDSGRSVQVAKVCDEIVIHVANTDQKGIDTIRREIMNVLEELGEG
ncbi:MULTISPECIES: phage tail tape measure protein [Bacteroidales]|jgi:TP901 family phage tail tape measure protein|uniref:phage tail tape measure protein n=1 Tax=Bacteroidales TaxID=171549 RepID=UPI000930C483|nr:MULTISPECIES: phage tail tape measure protein [Bacteroidales]